MRPRDMWYSKHTGKVVSMAKSLQSSQQYAGSKLAFWNRCTKEARRILGYHGRFVPIKGKLLKGCGFGRLPRRCSAFMGDSLSEQSPVSWVFRS